ncbi:MAG: hypothetical protein H0Z38_00200 [Firmicutes bacterium]|nr:hypothetical protein [Bacillota bacterium]
MDFSYRCVLCGRLSILFTRLGSGCICAKCEREVLASMPGSPGYLERAHLISRCFASRMLHWLEGEFN